MFAQQGYFVVAINPSGSTTFGQGIYPSGSPRLRVTDTTRFSDLTDAIKEDWGGKPFVDLRKGWKYILDNYPQVRGPVLSSITRAYSGPTDRQESCRRCWCQLWRIRHQVYFRRSCFLVTSAEDIPSWIQSNPDFGFGFKALVCHDGVCVAVGWQFETNSSYHKVFDSQYNGYSTDELFFVGS